VLAFLCTRLADYGLENSRLDAMSALVGGNEQGGYSSFQPIDVRVGVGQALDKFVLCPINVVRFDSRKSGRGDEVGKAIRKVARPEN
jgi:hypothetical protein